MLEVCLLGSGGMMPLPNRWLTALLLRHNGRMLLIDCGEGTQIPMDMKKWGFKALDTILLTHYHADHVAGLPGLLCAISNANREEPLKILGPAGLKQVIGGLTVITPQLSFPIELIEIPPSSTMEYKAGNLLIKALPVDHALPCFAYTIELKRQGKFDVKRAKELQIPVPFWNKLQDGETVISEDCKYTPDMVTGPDRKGLKLCYCTDTRPIDTLIPFTEHADIFICEGMYGNPDNLCKAIAKKHMLFSEAAEIAKQSMAGELWLTHFSPSLTEPEEELKYAKVIFENTVLGRALLSKTLRFEEE